MPSSPASSSPVIGIAAAISAPKKSSPGSTGAPMSPAGSAGSGAPAGPPSASASGSPPSWPPLRSPPARASWHRPFPAGYWPSSPLSKVDAAVSVKPISPLLRPQNCQPSCCPFPCKPTPNCTVTNTCTTRNVSANSARSGNNGSAWRQRRPSPWPFKEKESQLVSPLTFYVLPHSMMQLPLVRCQHISPLPLSRKRPTIELFKSIFNWSFNKVWRIRPWLLPIQSWRMSVRGSQN